MPAKASSSRTGASGAASPASLSNTATSKRNNANNANTTASGTGRSHLSATQGELQRGASGHNLGASYGQQQQADGFDELAYETQQQEFSKQRQEFEQEESMQRQRHEAMQGVALKIISIEFSKQKDPLGYYKLTKPAAEDDVAHRICNVKLMTCNRAMKPFSIPVPLPQSDSDLDTLTLGELKARVFQAAKNNYVDPIMLPLLQPHMQVLYNNQGKQIGRVEDKEAMEKWIAAHPPPTKKLSAAEKAALPPPPPMPTVESNSSCVRECGVEAGSTIYVAIRVAAQEVAGSDAHEQVEANRPAIIPPVNPKDLKKRSKAANTAASSNTNAKTGNEKVPNSAGKDGGGRVSNSAGTAGPTSPSAGRRRG